MSKLASISSLEVLGKTYGTFCPRNFWTKLASFPMEYALSTFGGFLAGFSSGKVPNMRHNLRYTTSLVTIMDSLQLRRKSKDLTYGLDVACKSAWALCSRAFQLCAYLVRCEFIGVHASHYTDGAWGKLDDTRLALEQKAGMFRCDFSHNRMPVKAKL